VVERELIARHMRTLAEMEGSGLVAMFDDDKLDDLARIYSLFKRVAQPISGLGILRDLLFGHVRDQGKALVNSTSDDGTGGAQRDPVAFVDELLKLKARYDSIIEGPFAADKLFSNMLSRCARRRGRAGRAAGQGASRPAPADQHQPASQPGGRQRCAPPACPLSHDPRALPSVARRLRASAFESFVNLNGTAPEFLSLYVDNLLRKEVKGGAAEDETEATLDKVVMLFRFLQEKDVFAKYYKQHLAKRLLR
jgi:cullin 3